MTKVAAMAEMLVIAAAAKAAEMLVIAAVAKAAETLAIAVAAEVAGTLVLLVEVAVELFECAATVLRIFRNNCYCCCSNARIFGI